MYSNCIFCAYSSLSKSEGAAFQSIADDSALYSWHKKISSQQSFNGYLTVQILKKLSYNAELPTKMSGKHNNLDKFLSVESTKSCLNTENVTSINCFVAY